MNVVRSDEMALTVDNNDDSIGLFIAIITRQPDSTRFI